MRDPAFLFYSSDFLTGTMFFTNEQLGKYIRLLCAQHQQGHLSEKHMIHICGTHDKDIFDKFQIDENGLYFSPRLKYEIDRRANYSESRRSNRKGKKEDADVEEKPKEEKHISNTYDKHMSLHMENENENRIKNKKENVIEKASQVLAYLNQQANRSFKPKESTTLKHIIARLKEGHEHQVLFDVIDLKCYEWLNDAKMCEYLRPDTLFNQTKFDNYIEQLTRAKQNPQQFKNQIDGRNNKQDGLSEMQRYKQDLLNGIYRE